MKKVLWVLAVTIFMSNAAALAADSPVSTFSVSPPSITDMAPKLGNAISIGYVTQGTKEVGVISWTPDFKVGIFGLGLNVNIPLGKDNVPTGVENVVVRYAELDNGNMGLRYGVLDNYTLGQGLLVNNYSSRTKGSSILSNEQVAWKGYYKNDLIKVEAIDSWSSLYAVRVTERVHPMIELGQTYVNDPNGVDVKDSAGNTNHFPAQAGYGIDVVFPIWPGVQPYIDYSKLVNYGGGLSAGVNSGLDLMSLGRLMFKAEYRALDRNFVPGYFNDNYETNPINLASVEASTNNKNGYLLQADAAVLDIFSAMAAFESYEKSNPTLTARAKVDYDKYYVQYSFNQSNFVDFRSFTLDNGAVLNTDIGYKVNPNTLLIWHYKSAYDPTVGQVVNSSYYEAKIGF